MKVTFDIDCTPEEARRFMGLPDLTAVHAIYIDKLARLVDQGVTPDMLDGLLRTWGPMGDAGLQMWRKMFDSFGGQPKG